MTAEEFAHTYALTYEHEVEFGEIDMLRHTNNVRYAVWAETIRSVYLADVIGEDIWGRQGMIIARHDLHYEAPVRYRDRLTIGGRITRLGKKSFDFETAVWVQARALRAFRAVATLVAYDYESERSIHLPEDWRTKIIAFEHIRPATPMSPRFGEPN